MCANTRTCAKPAREGRVTCESCAANKMRTYERNKNALNLQRSMRKFGLTANDFHKMFDAQAGLCAICQQPESAMYRGERLKRLAVDHDHDSGEVRGLLCNNCNRALGMFKDDAVVLRAAADYLELYA